MSSVTFENWGDYFWPGQIDHCRRNLLGEHDPERLEHLERKTTVLRHQELESGRACIPRTFDLDHVRAIHKYLFEPVYEWAGELRVTELVRPATNPDAPGHEFVKPDDIERLAGMVFGQLGDPAKLATASRDEQIEVLASTYSGLNVLHPFVEGNGRTQRVFLQDAAHAAGVHVEWQNWTMQNETMARAFSEGPGPVAEALDKCLVIHVPAAASAHSASFPQPARNAAAAPRPGTAIPAAEARRRPTPDRTHTHGQGL